MIQILPGGKYLKFSSLQLPNFSGRIFLLTVNKDPHRIYYILL
nr:MAG TPA: hypothetical protein [Caudoviricetes sp.]